MRRYFAEGVATFTLVFCGTGAVVINEVTGGTVTHVGIGLTFGLVVLAMIFAVRDISGAHMNPAVSLGFWMAGRFSSRDVLPYVISQCTGAIAASLCLKMLFPQSQNLGATLPAGSGMQSLILETFLMFFLMFVILRVSTGPKEKGVLAGIAVGAIVALEAIFAGPISGASMNPARSLGPALVSGNMKSLWIYWVAPALGATWAVLCWRVTQERTPSSSVAVLSVD